jgi:hypothetical protein
MVSPLPTPNSVPHLHYNYEVVPPGLRVAQGFVLLCTTLLTTQLSTMFLKKMLKLILIMFILRLIMQYVN